MTDRIERLTTLIVEIVQDGDDLGDALSAALGAAANELGSVEALVEGRPGSWEADHVRQLAVPYATTGLIGT